jgi:hypothetical protein
VISSGILDAAKQIRPGPGRRSSSMKNLVCALNVNTAASSRQARFSFAGFYCYAYFYFFGMDNSRACLG